MTDAAIELTNLELLQLLLCEIDREIDRNVDVGDFCSLFERGCALLGFDDERAAKVFDVSVTDASRWRRGVAVPPAARLVLCFLREEISRRIDALREVEIQQCFDATRPLPERLREAVDVEDLPAWVEQLVYQAAREIESCDAVMRSLEAPSSASTEREKLLVTAAYAAAMVSIGDATSILDAMAKINALVPADAEKLLQLVLQALIDRQGRTRPSGE